MGDDIGQANISAYTLGVMGYRTPNIDRIAKEGLIFTDYYAEQSCTLGRSSFITGQATLRTGLSKVGLPAATLRSATPRHHDRTGAKPLGYATGQFGKNHLGDRNEFLPTVHGFDEFFGKPSITSTPRRSRSIRTTRRIRSFRAVRSARRAAVQAPGTQTTPLKIHASAGSASRPSRIRRARPKSAWRRSTTRPATQRSTSSSGRRAPIRPFFVWFNSTRMHAITHVRPTMLGQSGINEYADGMIEHDGQVGKLLKTLDDLNIANETIVIYTTDNGPHMNSWPDAAMTPFRNEKNSNWEGAFRVPAMVRWPGRIKAGSIRTRSFPGSTGSRRCLRQPAIPA